MNIRKHIYEYHKKKLNEALEETDEGFLRPDLKYYAFDWDDNIMFMPTKIMLMTSNEEEIGMSTEDFAEHRLQIGNEPFNYKGTKIVGFAPDPFRFFRTEGDKRFIIDAMTAPVGPAWNDFVECINGGSIFAIITARGHNPETLKEAVLNLILSSKNGINKGRLEDNLKKYSEFETVNEQSPILSGSLIKDYLDKCKFHPVSFGEGSATSPEEGKNKALKEFISYCKEQARSLIKSILQKNPKLNMTDLSPVFKNDLSMMEPIEDIDEFLDNHMMIGFSDDDERNIKASSEFLSKEYEKNPVNLYLTKGGNKTRY